MAEPTFFQFTSAALDALRGEVPSAYLLLCKALEGRSVGIAVDGESRVLRVTPLGHEWLRDSVAPVRLRTCRSVLLEMAVDGRRLLDAVVSDNLAVSGSVEDVVRLLDALDAFIRGAVRSRTVKTLFDAYVGRPGGDGNRAFIFGWQREAIQGRT